MIASQQSSLLLVCALLAVLGLLRHRRGAWSSADHHGGPVPYSIGRSSDLRRAWPLRCVPVRQYLPPRTSNLRRSGMAVLRRDCPAAAWRLCPFLDTFPPTSDEFLWQQNSPLNQAGGPKVVSQDADAIIRAALISDPAGEARAALSNTLEQLGRFASGDGLSPGPPKSPPKSSATRVAAAVCRRYLPGHRTRDGFDHQEPQADPAT